MIVRKLSWHVLVLCVACGKIAGFDDLQGSDGSDAESGAGGEWESGGNAGKGGAGASAGVAGASNGGASGHGRGGSAGAAATGGSSDGEGGSGDVPAAGGTSGSAGSGASGGVAGGGAVAGSSEAGGSAGSMESGGSAGAVAGSSGAASGGAGAGGGTGGAGTGGASGGGGGGAGIGNPSGCGELLVNGGFEDGRLGWDVMTSYPNLELNVHAAIVERDDAALVAAGVAPYAGDFLGWAGGVPDSNRNHSLFVMQPIVLSEDVTELTFSGYFRIESDEPTDTFYDALYVEVLDLEYDRVWQFGAFSNEHAGPWFAIDPIDPYPDDLEPMRGRQFYLGIYSRTDSDTVTHFFFDSLSLVALCE